jgi:hypothetical protein
MGHGLRAFDLEVLDRLVVHSGRSLIRQYTFAGVEQIERRKHFVTQRVPSSSWHPALACCQHAIRPHASVRPVCNSRWRSGRGSRERHCRRFGFLTCGHFASTFLRGLCSTGVTPLHRYYARSDSYTAALRTRVTGRTGITAHELRLVCVGLPVSWYRTFRPFHLQPPAAFPRACLSFPPSGLPRITVFPERISFETLASLGFHHHQKADQGSRPNRVRHDPMDQSFTSRCSPPCLATTQLRFDYQAQTSLDSDLHRASSIHLQAHWCRRLACHRPASLARRLHHNQLKAVSKSVVSDQRRSYTRGSAGD